MFSSHLYYAGILYEIKTRGVKVLLLLSLCIRGTESHAHFLSDATEAVRKVGRDIVQATKNAGEEISNTAKEIGNDLAQETKKIAGDIERETKKAGGDIAREWKNLPPEVQVGLIVVAATAGGYFLAPVIGAEFVAGIALDMGAGNVIALPLITTANTGAVITGVGAGAAYAATLKKEKEEEKKENEETKVSELSQDTPSDSKTNTKAKPEAKKIKSKPEIAENINVIDTIPSTSLDLFNEEQQTPTEVPDSKNIREKLQELIQHYCFVAGTRVRTPKGHLAIEKLKVGDLVVSCDFV